MTTAATSSNITQEFKTPAAYLQAMDVILSSKSMLNASKTSPSNSAIPPAPQMIEELLNKARSLLVENAVTLLLRTLRSVKNNRELPEFWSEHLIGSCEEANLWLNIFDIIIYSWTKCISPSSTSGGMTTMVRSTSSSLTEDYLKTQCDKIVNLRSQLKGTELSQVDTDLAQYKHRYAELLGQCRVKDLFFFTTLKQAPHPMLLIVMQLYLQVVGIRPMGVHTASSFGELKTAISTLSMAHLSKLGDSEKLTNDHNLMAHVRKSLSNHNQDSAASNKLTLLNPDDMEAAIDLNGLPSKSSPEWKHLRATCSMLLECFLLLEKMNRLKLRSFVQTRPQEFRTYLHCQAERIVVRQLNVLLEYSQFSRLISSDYFSDIQRNRRNTICSEESEDDPTKNGKTDESNGNYRSHRSDSSLMLPENKCFQVIMKKAATILWQEGERGQIPTQ